MFVLLCVGLRLFCHNTKPPAAASHWHSYAVAFVHPVMLIYSSAVYFYFCRVFFLHCWGGLFIIIFIYVLLWEHQRDRWLWALCVREERMRESQKDNKASGWERVPYFFSSLACCFLLCLALSQHTESEDTDIFKSAGFAGPCWPWLCSPRPPPHTHFFMGQQIHHNTIIIPPHSSILWGFQFLLHLECHIQINVNMFWCWWLAQPACYHGNHPAASATASLLPPPPSWILSPAASWPLYILANLPADCRGGGTRAERGRTTRNEMRVKWGKRERTWGWEMTKAHVRGGKACEEGINLNCWTEKVWWWWTEEKEEKEAIPHLPSSLKPPQYKDAPDLNCSHFNK